VATAVSVSSRPTAAVGSSPGLDGNTGPGATGGSSSWLPKSWPVTTWPLATVPAGPGGPGPKNEKQGPTPTPPEALEAAALAQADPEARRACEEAGPARFRATVLLSLVREHVARGLAPAAVPVGDR
jgi:hypothetical protein